MRKAEQSVAPRSRARRVWAGMLASLLAVALTGCPDEANKETASKDEADAGANRALMDKNIEKAMKSVAGAPTAAATSVDGPPPNGVFPPGLADKAHAPGAAPKIEIVDRGSEPRIKLRPAALTDKQSFTVTVGKRYAQNLFPSVDYQLTAGMVEAEEGADTPPPPQLLVTVDKSTLSAQQMGQVPEEVKKQVESLSGTKITFPLAPSGQLATQAISLPKDAPAGLSELVGALGEILTLVLPPWPDEAVGQGAYWVSTDRAVVSGVPVVRYRVTRIETVSGDEIAYTLEIRQYAVDPSSMPVGVPAGMALQAFQAQGKGSLTRKAGVLFPSSAQVKSPIVMQLANPQQPQRILPVQVETTGQLTAAKAAEGDKKKGDEKKGDKGGGAQQKGAQQKGDGG